MLFIFSLIFDDPLSPINVAVYTWLHGHSQEHRKIRVEMPSKENTKYQQVPWEQSQESASPSPRSSWQTRSCAEAHVAHVCMWQPHHMQKTAFHCTPPHPLAFRFLCLLFISILSALAGQEVWLMKVSHLVQSNRFLPGRTLTNYASALIASHRKKKKKEVSVAKVGGIPGL